MTGQGQDMLVSGSHCFRDLLFLFAILIQCIRQLILCLLDGTYMGTKVLQMIFLTSS